LESSQYSREIGEIVVIHSWNLLRVMTIWQNIAIRDGMDMCR